MPLLTNIRYILITALRDRLFLGLMAAVVAATLISGVLGGTAMVESQQMTLVFAASAARMILAVGMIVFVCFHIRQAFDSKEIDVILSRPLSRARLVFSYWLGFSLVAVILVLPTMALIGSEDGINPIGFWSWSASLLLEAFLIVALALFASLTLKSGVTSVMASLGFYVLSRMMGFFVATSHSAMLFTSDSVNLVTRSIISAVSTLIPRLDFFAKSEWLVYGLKKAPPASAGGSAIMLTESFQQHQEIFLYSTQTLLFVPLLLAAAIADFERRQF